MAEKLARRSPIELASTFESTGLASLAGGEEDAPCDRL